MQVFLFKGDARCVHCIRDRAERKQLTEVNVDGHAPQFKTLDGHVLPELTAEFCGECSTS